VVDKEFRRKTEQEGEPRKADCRKAHIRGMAGMIKPDLKRVILRELKLDDWPIEPETLATEIPGWDSLSHASVILAVEKAFGVRFSNLEVLKLNNIGDLQRLLDSKRQ
jgi:acyl carrier protein